MSIFDYVFPRNICLKCGRLLEAPRELAEGLCGTCRPLFKEPEHPLCPRCGRHSEDGGLCKSCRSAHHAFDEARVAFDYIGAAREAILAFKFRGKGYWKEFLTLSMQRVLPPDWKPDVIVCVPTHPMRRLLRLRSTGEALAKGMARRLDLPQVRALRRSKNVRPMYAVRPNQRRALAESSYALRKDANLSGHRVLLVDDILTTGSSADTCSRLLREAGATSVFLLCAAGALPREERRQQEQAAK